MGVSAGAGARREARNGRMCPFCAPPRVQGRELRPALRQIALAHDVVPVEHGPRLVAGELHGDRSGTPARTRFCTAVRRGSCGMRSSSSERAISVTPFACRTVAARRQADFHAA